MMPFLVLSMLSSCVKDENNPGYEFMPDMYRSPSLEIYASNTFFEDSLNARLPVDGTIPRGFVGFDYESNLEDYLEAGVRLVNPYDLNEANLEKGEKLYQIFCAHCHGKMEMVREV